MTTPQKPQKPQGSRNVGASVWQRLRNQARANGDEVALILLRYVGERFLYRLSQSPHRDRFVLKGATLFTLWQDKPHRATRDLDFLGSGDSSPEAIRRVITEVAAFWFPDDGVLFLPDTLTVEARTVGRVYGGLHLEIEVALATTRPRLEIDIAFGEAVTPTPREETLPTLLPGMSAPVLWVYPRETVVAEKCEAIVNLGIANTRMKDFYDLWYLSQTFTFEAPLLAEAIRATFQRRETPLPSNGLPFALTDSFADDTGKSRQWQAFLAKTDLESRAISLREVVRSLRVFLQPCLTAAVQPEEAFPFADLWSAGGPWRS